MRAGGSSAVARRLGTQSLIVLLGNLFTLVVGLPLQIYVARVLGVGALGQYGLLEGAVNTANGFLNLGIAQTAVRFIPGYIEKQEFGHVRHLLKLAITILLLVGGGSYLVLLVALPMVERQWPELQGQTGLIALMGLLMPLGLVMFLLQQALRSFYAIRHMILGVSVLQLSVKAIITVAVFVAGFRLGGYVLANLAAILVGIVWMAAGLWRRLKALPRREAQAKPPTKEWKRYALLVYSNSLLGVSTAYIDRFLLSIFVGLGSVGVLLAVRQLQQLPQMFNQMLLMVAAPGFAAAHARNDAAEREHLYVLVTDWLMKASLPLIVFLLLFSQPVLALFGPQFASDGVIPLWVLLAGQIFNLACGPIGNIAMMSGLEAPMLRLSVYNTVLTALLMVALAPVLGLLGVAIATTVATVCLNISVMSLLRKRFALRWWNERFRDWILPTAASAAVGFMVVYAAVGANAVVLAGALVAMYGVFAGVLILQGLREDEKDVLQHLRTRLLTPGVRA